MEGSKQKHTTNHVIIVTSDAVDANVRQFKIRTWVLGLIMIVLFAVFGALLGYLFYEERIWQAAIDKSNQQLHAMEELTAEKDRVKAAMERKEQQLNQEIQTLENEVEVLSTTLNEKVESEKKLTEELEKLSVPTGFPINGSATDIETTGIDRPSAKITALPGTMVIASARGTVIAVNDDVEYGHNVWVDHGNGYVTIYRNQGTPFVKRGDEVFLGTALFLIDEKGTSVGYQIMLDGNYVNPLDLIEIKG
ncbi:MAG: peptidoglycan DD-metalloendopeptidase family protein [Lachnospiraceae bacterium]|nr:peptidoglycan DD-metalloendopeptidase family protein [Lachnospiraceae bacterium]